MILPGHVAAASLVSKALGVDLRAALAVSMVPDLIDKPVRWLFRLTPNDRIPAHTLLGWALTSAVAGLLGGRRFAAGWVAGYGSHLLCDEVNAHLNPGRIYFWWPFKRYTMHIGPTGLQSSLNDFRPASVALEVGLTLVALAVWGREYSRRRQGGQCGPG
ncbi:MAG: metal-dependent hydrolase [Chloroflexi bacterium]|jgi:hypothetical protein|nr:metal-dependent hydrolase [Chloroflexota bacterium]